MIIANPQLLITIGAGGISFLVVITMVLKALPILQDLRNASQIDRQYIEQLVSHQQVYTDQTMKQISKMADNFSAAIKQIEESNNNVAKSLDLLSNTQKDISVMLHKQDARLQQMSTQMAVITHQITGDVIIVEQTDAIENNINEHNS